MIHSSTDGCRLNITSKQAQKVNAL